MEQLTIGQKVWYTPHHAARQLRNNRVRGIVQDIEYRPDGTVSFVNVVREDGSDGWIRPERLHESV